MHFYICLNYQTLTALTLLHEINNQINIGLRFETSLPVSMLHIGESAFSISSSLPFNSKQQ